MGESEKKALIQKLEAISELNDRASAITRKMKTYTPEDNYEREVIPQFFPGDFDSSEERLDLESSIDHSDEDAIEQMASEYDMRYAPRKPAEPRVKEFEYRQDSESQSKQAKFGCFSYIAGAIGAFFLLSLIIGSAEGAVGTIATIAIIFASLFVFFRYKIKLIQKEVDENKANALEVYTDQKNTIMFDYEEKLRNYESEAEAYAQTRENFLQQYSEWRESYLECQAEEREIAKKLEADRVAGVEKIEAEEFNPVIQEMASINDIIAIEYLPAIKIIIDLLKSGRADDLKEAINLYEDIVYRERQLQLEREREQQRRREEQQRREAEERRYQEEKQFREDQERQRQREAEQQRADEERRYREEVRARKESEAEARKREYMEKERLRKESHRAQMDRIDQERKQRDAGQAQCRACIHCGHCNMSIHNNAPTCTGFRPR
ncbi:MAG: hypothetical protein IKZ23_02625 [Clostridia bacterium]|nr:hypothetical protein [Clostridia bacterium]